MHCNDDASAIELFAQSSEALNEFSRALWKNSTFGDVRAGADIRNYESGWRLEKYIEAEIDANRGLWAAWWLELGHQDHNWIVESSVSISHSNVYIEFPKLVAKNTEELEIALKRAVDALISSIKKGQLFVKEIERIKTELD